MSWMVFYIYVVIFKGVCLSCASIVVYRTWAETKVVRAPLFLYSKRTMNSSCPESLVFVIKIKVSLFAYMPFGLDNELNSLREYKFSPKQFLEVRQHLSVYCYSSTQSV